MSSAVRTSGTARVREAIVGLDNATIIYIAIALLAFAIASGLVFLELATKIGLYGVTQFDDDVYFAATVHFVNGSLPYRDYVLVQPPGIAVVLAPFGILGRIVGVRDGLAIVRIATGVVAGLNAVGVVMLLRRYGYLAALFGGLLFAVFPPAYNADHTLMLEPYLVIFCLIAMLFAFPSNGIAGKWRLFAAGLSLGVASSIKVWGIFPLLAILVVLGVSDWRRALRVLTGAIVGAVACCGVFFAAAPGAFIRDVISSQLGRTTAHPTPVFTRLWSIVGLDLSSSSLLVQRCHVLIAIVTCVIIFMLATGSVIPSIVRRGSQFESYVLLATVLTIGSLFVPEQFYAHYAYFTAPFLAIGLGIALSRLVSMTKAITQPIWTGARVTIRSALTLALVAALTAGAAITVQSEHRFELATMGIFGDPGARVTADIPKGACVVSDAEGLLIAGDRALSSRAGCPVVVDSTGTWISFVPDHPPAAKGVEVSSPALVAYWASVFSHVDYIVLSSGIAFRIPWTPALRAYVKTHFHSLPGFAPIIYKADDLSPSAGYG
jgi:alpha-1,2-mannosyltransferase